MIDFWALVGPLERKQEGMFINYTVLDLLFVDFQCKEKLGY